MCAALACALLCCSCLFLGCAESESSRESSSSDSPSAKPAANHEDEASSSSAAVSSASPVREKEEKPIPKAAREAISKLVEPYGDSVAVSLSSLDGTAQFDVNGGDRFVSASMIKLLVLACLMDEVDKGSITLDQTYKLKSSDIVGGTAHINALPVGTSLSYDELAESMIAYSDNTATNILIDVLGMDAINAEAKALGLSATSLQRKMMDFGGSKENYMSANDAAKILSGFACGKIGNAKLSKKAMGYLKAQTDNAALAQGIPKGVTFAHKTGSLDNVRHDGGVVYADEPYILVVFTSIGLTEGNGLMAELSAAVYKALQE